LSARTRAISRTSRYSIGVPSFKRATLAHKPGREDLGIRLRDMAAGLGIGLGRLIGMEDGTASEEDEIFYWAWLSRIQGWSAGERHLQMQRAKDGGRFR
jgi:hypothetical protein